eukprot:9492843-Pyramimonas_sp.AAC.1
MKASPQSLPLQRGPDAARPPPTALPHSPPSGSDEFVGSALGVEDGGVVGPSMVAAVPLTLQPMLVQLPRLRTPFLVLQRPLLGPLSKGAAARASIG